MKMFVETLEKAKPYFNKIKNILDRYEDSFSLEENIYFRESIPVHTKYINDGLYELENWITLRNIRWSKYNTRDGIDSLKGLTAECIFVAKYNSSNKGKGSARLAPENKATQLRGTDVFFTHDSWKQGYIGQIKSTHLVDDSLMFYARYLTYNIQDVDRLILVDIEKEKCFIMDYTSMVIQLVTRFNNTDIVSVKIEELKKNRSLYFKEL